MLANKIAISPPSYSASRLAISTWAETPYGVFASNNLDTPSQSKDQSLSLSTFRNHSHIALGFGAPPPTFFKRSHTHCSLTLPPWISLLASRSATAFTCSKGVSRPCRAVVQNCFKSSWEGRRGFRGIAGTVADTTAGRADLLARRSQAS